MSPELIALICVFILGILFLWESRNDDHTYFQSQRYDPNKNLPGIQVSLPVPRKFTRLFITIALIGLFAFLISLFSTFIHDMGFNFMALFLLSFKALLVLLISYMAFYIFWVNKHV